MEANFLPLFPLNLVVFPKEKLNLYVFEPRYKQLIKDCEEHNTNFGIPVYLNGKVKEYGTEMRLEGIERVHSNGEMDIRTKAIRPFRLQSFKKRTEDKLYPTGQVVFQENIEDDDFSLRLQIKKQVMLLYEALKVKQSIPNDFVSFEVAHNIGLSIEQEYELLKIKKESARLKNILEHLKEIVPVVIHTEKIKEKVQMNGHFKNLDILDL